MGKGHQVVIPLPLFHMWPALQCTSQIGISHGPHSGHVDAPHRGDEGGILHGNGTQRWDPTEVAQFIDFTAYCWLLFPLKMCWLFVPGIPWGDWYGLMHQTQAKREWKPGTIFTAVGFSKLRREVMLALFPWLEKVEKTWGRRAFNGGSPKRFHIPHLIHARKCKKINASCTQSIS